VAEAVEVDVEGDELLDEAEEVVGVEDCVTEHSKPMDMAESAIPNSPVHAKIE
jgi:hypothetical protein